MIIKILSAAAMILAQVPVASIPQSALAAEPLDGVLELVQSGSVDMKKRRAAMNLFAHALKFHGDDLEARRIARRLLRKKIAETALEEADISPNLRSSLQTAWVNVAH